jgi:hypothetical protein
MVAHPRQLGELVAVVALYLAIWLRLGRRRR